MITQIPKNDYADTYIGILFNPRNNASKIFHDILIPYLFEGVEALAGVLPPEGSTPERSFRSVNSGVLRKLLTVTKALSVDYADRNLYDYW